MTLNDWFQKNYSIIERTAKDLLYERYGEGVSEYYIHLINKDQIPISRFHTYWFMKNLKLPNSKINYIPTVLRNAAPDDFDTPDTTDYSKIDLMIDLNDEIIVDFLINNYNNERWLKIYNSIYGNKIQLNLFEQILFEYVFINGYSISKIKEITGNSQSFIYKMRKELIEKIKREL
jgi:hypothetical protein